MFNLPAENDLDASVDLIAFMWQTTGHAAESLTIEVCAVMRLLLAENFAQLPPELQLLFANGQANNNAIQTAWNMSNPLARLAMAQQFQQLLAVLGLVPGEAGSQSPSQTGSGQSLNADIAANIAWNSSGAGNWSSR
jgi:hypothetical protein